jgi:uncharacterized protein (DUF302 family)/rhodanese-related sulfurtransferase
MSSINLKKEILGSMESAIDRVTEALKTQGFGVLTRIDLHKKVKEKLGKDLSPVVILGACNPQLAFEAYSQNPDVASLLPCNAVLRDLGHDRVSVELAKPSALMTFLGDEALVKMALDADARLMSALESLTSAPVQEWSAQELSHQTGNCELIDVRNADEFTGPLSHIPGAALVTLGPKLDAYLMERRRATLKVPLVFICRSGVRSLKAAQQAGDMGISPVVNLKGGMLDWNQSKLPTQSPARGEDP